MTVVVDTSILIDHLRGDVRARDALVGALESNQWLIASVMTKVEVLAGMRRGEERATQRLLTLFHWVPVDEAIADLAGQMAHQYLRSHPGVDAVDFVIAATVEAADADLWTRNLNHFPMLRRVSNPYMP